MQVARAIGLTRAGGGGERVLVIASSRVICVLDMFRALLPVPVRIDERPLLPCAPVRAGCGFPSPADDYIEDPIDLIDRLCPHRHATFLFPIVGSSMTGRKVHDGDVAIVDRAVTPRAGRLVIACLDGGFVLRELRGRAPTAELWEHPTDRPPRRTPTSEEVEVWGVVRSTVTPHLHR